MDVLAAGGELGFEGCDLEFELLDAGVDLGGGAGGARGFRGHGREGGHDGGGGRVGQDGHVGGVAERLVAQMVVGEWS